MATPRNPLETFIWGSGGRAMTPEQVAREREIAAALTDQGADFSPVGHWLQGAARLGHSAAGAFRNWRADEAESAGRGAFSDRWSSVFGGGSSPVAEALSGGLASPALDAANAVAAMPTGDMADRIRSGLMDRGLPEHVANAFILNMQDESGLNPGINEAAPIVPGSRGGYGLYQLTGPRRRDYEAFAAQRGVAPDDVDAQLDWLMHELSGPEARAAQSILSAQDTPTAAAAIVNEFLRPAEEHRTRRANAYMSGGGSMPSAQPVQVAQAGGSPSIAELLSLSGDPNFGYASPAQQQIVQALMGQQLQQQDPAYQQQLAMRDLQMQQLQQQLGAPNLMNVGGQLYNPDTQEWIAPPAAPAAPEFMNVETPSGIRTFNLSDPDQNAQVQELFASGQGRQVGLGAGDSSAQQRIERLTENLMATGTVVDPSQAEAVATAIADNRYRESRHPTTGEVVIVDMATGRPVSHGGQFNPDGLDISDGEVAPDVPQESRFGSPYPSADQAFGLEGAARGFGNMVAGAFGGTLDPQVQQTQADFAVLRESLINDIASTYGRQPPSWLLRNIEDLTPQAGNPFLGPDQAQSKLRSIGRQLENELNVAQNTLQNTTLTPAARQEIELRIQGINSGISRVNTALQSFGRPAQPGETAPSTDGEGWLDLGGGIRMREVR